MNTTIWCLIILAVSVVAVIILAIIDSKKNHPAATPPLDMKFGIPKKFGVAEGPHGECVTYYSSRREYRKSRRQSSGNDTYYMDPSF